jgi:hypothetical protein
VLGAFRRFEVWEPGRFPSAPRAEFDLDALPEQYETLLFLAGDQQRPLLVRGLLALNREIAAGKRSYDPFGDEPDALPLGGP